MAERRNVTELWNSSRTAHWLIPLTSIQMKAQFDLARA